MTLLGVARKYRRNFAPAWIFPLVLLFAPIAAERLELRIQVLMLVLAPLFFATFLWSSLPGLRGKIGAWQSGFWAMLVPFLIFGLLLLGRGLLLS